MLTIIAVNWRDAKLRVLKSYREWLRAVSIPCAPDEGHTNAAFKSPEIQTMYSLNMPVSAIRTKVRQEFERHRYVSQLNVVDVLLFQSHSEFQVRRIVFYRLSEILMWLNRQETLNYWKQLSHVMKYFKTEDNPNARLPNNFMQGFLEVSASPTTAL